METIKVNMNPNPLDVQTIHASQNDNEAREWGFELHNNGEKIDSSSISDQLVFKAYEGGTEQILPENGSVPVTSPFKGDIKYPQGLLTDQEFLYRQSPTEEDGLAKITDIKGNTLNWNQLHRKNPSQSSTQTVTKNGVSLTSTRSGNITTYTASGTVAITTEDKNYYINIDNVDIIASHKYLGLSSSKYFSLYGYSAGTLPENQQMFVWTASTSAQMSFTVRPITSTFVDGTVINETFYLMFFDLTKMGLDITDPSDFTSLFPLPYYAYNQGSLLSFNGNGIKTVGKNLLEPPTSGSVNGVTFTVNSDGSITVNGTATSNGTYDFYRNTSVLPSWAKLGKTYTLSLTNPINRFSIHSYDSSGTVTALVDTSTASRVFTIPNDAVGLLIRIFVTSGVTYDVIVYPQIEIGTSATSYEPYTSSTSSLPISTYFPNGMKSAGTVYDELTPSKAIKKLALFEITSANIQSSYLDTQNNQWLGFVSVSNIKQITDEIVVANILCNTLKTKNQGSLFGEVGSAITLLVNSTNVRITIEGITTFADMQTWLDNHPTYFVYELATPTETSFTTASLVTENAEIPLSNEDGVLIGKCTEQLSENPGFIDAKIKLSDADGECYSNKIQLHIERSPQ